MASRPECACGDTSALAGGKRRIIFPCAGTANVGLISNVAALQLAFAVVTSVNRDDLGDGGAEHFAKTIRWIRTLNEGCGVEVLIPDFRGSAAALQTVLDARPDVLNHNVETVPHLYRRVRPDADYAQSMTVLSRAAAFRDAHAPGLRTKSGIMVGLGETMDEVKQTVADLRSWGVDILTLGQYLQPSRKHLPIERYYTPEEFTELREYALGLGFKWAECGPLVRSSYHADKQVRALSPVYRKLYEEGEGKEEE